MSTLPDSMLKAPREFPISWRRVTSFTVLLVPAAWLFRVAAKIRRMLYTSRVLASEHIAVPVIIVGNISVGGTGKTPLVLWLAQFLRDAGFRPGIVSRGFGADKTNSREVPADGDAAASDFGDEPLLLARRSRCPVWVGTDRPATARALLNKHPECDVIISDDGLQHYRLARDVEIVVIDTARGFGNGFTLPAGPLREPRSRLNTVDIVVYNGAPPPAVPLSVRNCIMNLEGYDFYNLREPTRWVQPVHFLNRRLHAIAGMGNPQRFFDSLRALGLEFTPHAFADHHAYTASDLQFDDCDAVLMTEKDAVKCAAFAGAEHWVLRVDAKVEPALGALILETLGKRT